MLLWDFDGTLADSFSGIYASVVLSLAEQGLAPVDQSVVRSLIGLNLDAMFTGLVASLDDGRRGGSTDADTELVESLVAGYRTAYREIGRQEVSLFPQVAGLLDALQAQGTMSAIVTSKSRIGVLYQLERLGLRDYFAAVVSNDDVTRGKPAPEMVFKACAELGCSAPEVLVIGDTVYDIEMGQRAGAVTCGVTWGNHGRDRLVARGPTYLVGSVDELEAVCAGR